VFGKIGQRTIGRRIEKLKALIEKTAQPAIIGKTVEVSRLADLLLTAEGGDPCQVKTAALLVAFVADAEDFVSVARELLEQTIVSVEEDEKIISLLQEVLSKSRVVGSGDCERCIDSF